jgi:hypothetical protein
VCVCGLSENRKTDASKVKIERMGKRGLNVCRGKTERERQKETKGKK